MYKILFLLLSFNVFFFCFNVDVNAVGSESICLMESNTNTVIYQKNMNTPNLTASICKIATAIVAIENVDLFENVVVTKDDYSEGSSVYLTEGISVLYIDLLYGLMLRSGNDCAMALANNTFGDYDTFILEMNLLARRIGMKNTVFENPTGLDSDTKNYSTSYDMALLMSYCVKNEVFVTISSSNSYKTYTSVYSVWYQKHKLVNTYEYALCGKTGYTKAANRTLVTYFVKGDMNLICVTFRINDDFNYHTYLFEKYVSKVSVTLILSKQVLKNFDGIDYLPKLEEDIYLPLASSKEISILYEVKSVCDSNCGYVYIFQYDYLIYETVLSEYRLDNYA